MGRGVMTIPDAVAVAYQSFGPDEDYYRAQYDDMYWLDETDTFDKWMYDQWNYGDSQFEWEALVDWIRAESETQWPTMEEADDWLGEVHVIAKNAHAVIGVSEYCGMVSISLAPNYDRDTYGINSEGLKTRWLSQISEKFLTLFSEFDKVGTASNGEQFLTKKGA